MLSFINKKLDLKIIIAVTFAVATLIGIKTYFDVKHVRADSILTSQRTLGAFAAAIKGSVTAAMKKGRHHDVRYILEEVDTPSFISRIIIYDENGRPLNGIEKFHDEGAPGMAMPPGILQGVLKGDVSAVTEQDGATFLSYYAPIENRKECFGCHGASAALNGILRVDFSLRDLNDLIIARRDNDIIWNLFLISLLIFILVVLLRILVYRPVRELRDAMANVREGESPVNLSMAGDDELTDLKKHFISMLERMNNLHRKNLEREKEEAYNQETIRFRNELQAMFNAMPDGVLLLDSRLRIVQSNRRVYELLPALTTAGGQAETVQQELFPAHSVDEMFKREGTTSSQCKISMPDGQQKHVHAISAPVMEEGHVKYIVLVIRDITERVRTERELEERTAELLVANRQLSKIAITDGLTQLYNRRYFDELLLKEIKRFNRRKYSHLCLMMVDIDHFKQLNDRYGHLSGDAVLREIATMLKENLRETDSVARYGGEEFSIIMPDTHLDGAQYRAEKLRKKIEEKVFHDRETMITITVSIGIARYHEGQPKDLIGKADQALYQAKGNGRNRVVVFLDSVDRDSGKRDAEPGKEVLEMPIEPGNAPL